MVATYPQVSLLGVGIMGRPLCAHLVKHETVVSLWNRTKEKAWSVQKTFGEDQVKVFNDPDDAVKESPCILVMLFDSKSIFEVLNQIRPENFKGKTFIVMSTISPDDSRKIHDFITSYGGQHIEAPVLGNGVVAEKGALTILVGSQKEQFDAWSGLLSYFGTPKHIGQVTKALVIKLAQNQILSSYIVTFATSLSLVEKANLPVDTFMDILVNGPFGLPFYHPVWKEKMTKREYSEVAFSCDGMHKDISLFAGVAKDLGLDTSYVHVVEQLFKKSTAIHKEDDFSGIYDVINPK